MAQPQPSIFDLLQMQQLGQNPAAGQFTPEMMLMQQQAAQQPQPEVAAPEQHATSSAVIKALPVKSMSMSMKMPSPGQDDLESKYNNLISDRMGGIEALKKKAAELEAQDTPWIQKANLQPLLAFADQLNGGKSSFNYVQPKEEEEKQAKLKALRDAVMKEQGAISDDQLGLLKERSQEQKMSMMLGKQDAAARRGEGQDEFKLRTAYEHNPLYKNMASLSSAYQAVENNPGDNGPAQQAMVYQFSKILDPNSVVRETEYATSAANAGAISQAQNYLTKLQSGQMLTPEQVKLMKEVARNLVESGRQALDEHNKTYTQLAMNKGIDPRNVVIDPFYKQKTQVQKTAVKPPLTRDEQAKWTEWLTKNPNHEDAPAIRKELGL